ncbi:haloacid dehalogenase [Longimycelium tulufanense]|uniref:Haloacid dehalogenase n=1 Tax=Longimycelium tulufanense TaxID=907463 RepID=A0A8J3CJT6_9PSEU|nr:HAD-IA family hydrolase [Longimycelium tulufanense]GGM80029.1 haloacid dehalogenase [Longimycelium tulufanense]
MELRGLVLDYGGVLTDPGPEPAAEPPLRTVLRRAREHGIRTALLSNAEHVEPEVWPPWWHELFDVVVLSGSVGLAKPDPDIYRFAAHGLDLPLESCVFVDDVAGYARGAAQAGMVGVHHVDVPSTIEELEALFAVDLT